MHKPGNARQERNADIPHPRPLVKPVLTSSDTTKGTTMKTILSIALATLISTSAFAASKGEDSASFRLKVATCKATAKTDGVKTNDAAFYAYMGACLDKVTVAVNVK